MNNVRREVLLHLPQSSRIMASLRRCVVRVTALFLAACFALCPSPAREYAQDHSDTFHPSVTTRDYSYSYDGAGNVVLAGRVDAAG